MSSFPEGSIRIDFSVAGDMSYYGGIVMSGFIRGISRSVLSGGQYDGLLQKMGRKSGAVGFALYLDLLWELEEERNDFDIDTLILYDEKTQLSRLFAKEKELTEAGKYVCTRRSVTEKLRYKELLDMRAEGDNK